MSQLNRRKNESNNESEDESNNESDNESEDESENDLVKLSIIDYLVKTSKDNNFELSNIDVNYSRNEIIDRNILLECDIFLSIFGVHVSIFYKFKRNGTNPTAPWLFSLNYEIDIYINYKKFLSVSEELSDDTKILLYAIDRDPDDCIKNALSETKQNNINNSDFRLFIYNICNHIIKYYTLY